MQIHFSYGDNGLNIELPDSTTIISPVAAQPITDVPNALQKALASPIDSDPLIDLIDKEDHVTIVFSDITRPVPNDMLAPALLDIIQKKGVPRDRITLLIGSGLHREMTREELGKMFGPDIVRNYRIVTHDARDADGVTFLKRYPGQSRGGIYLNKHYMESSVKIVTGFVEPHMFAGYSGGGKGILPGIAAAHNIMHNHSATNMIRDGATYGVANGNPLFDEMRSVAIASDVTFLCNVTANSDRTITGIYCGELTAAHDAAIAQVNQQALRPVPKEYDIVVCTNGGYPADLNLYQAVKGMVAAERAVRQGGTIILAAECREGVGSREYIELFQLANTPENLLSLMLQPDFSVIDQWCAQKQVMVQKKAEVCVYSSLDPHTIRNTHLIPCNNIEETVKEKMQLIERELKRPAEILAMPFGFQAIPVVEEMVGVS